MDYKKVMLSIDPGLSGTGWALWGDRRLRKIGILRAKRSSSVGWDYRAHAIAQEVSNLATTNYVQEVYVEFPQFFDSDLGQTVARRGDLLKLTTLVGIIAGRVFPTMCCLIPVNTWKGQLPKLVVERRVRARIGEVKFNKLRVRSHAVDAVGIGLYALGRF